MISIHELRRFRRVLRSVDSRLRTEANELGKLIRNGALTENEQRRLSTTKKYREGILRQAGQMRKIVDYMIDERGEFGDFIESMGALCQIYDDHGAFALYDPNQSSEEDTQQFVTDVTDYQNRVNSFANAPRVTANEVEDLFVGDVLEADEEEYETPAMKVPQKYSAILGSGSMLSKEQDRYAGTQPCFAPIEERVGPQPRPSQRRSQSPTLQALIDAGLQVVVIDGSRVFTPRV
jgi:hypothetical protein